MLFGFIGTSESVGTEVDIAECEPARINIGDRLLGLGTDELCLDEVVVLQHSWPTLSALSALFDLFAEVTTRGVVENVGPGPGPSSTALQGRDFDGEDFDGDQSSSDGFMPAERNASSGT